MEIEMNALISELVQIEAEACACISLPFLEGSLLAKERILKRREIRKNFLALGLNQESVETIFIGAKEKGDRKNNHENIKISN